MGAWPQSRLPVVVEIAPGADLSLTPDHWQWVDVTDKWLLAENGTITIGEGRTAWGQTVDASTISMTFLNDTGDLSEYNPLGQWYGLLGKDTPLRVRIRRAEDTFARSVSSGWGTSDAGQAWTTIGGSASDYSVAAGVATHAHTSAGETRRSVLNVNLVDVEQLVDVATPEALTGAGLATGVIARYTNGIFYWLRADIDPTGAVSAVISRADGDDVTDLDTLTVPGLTYTPGTPLRVRAHVVGQELAIKVWDPTGPEPAGWTLSLVDDDAEAITSPGGAGWQTRLVPGNSNAPPVLAQLASYQLHVDLAGGYVPTWAPRWDKSGKVRTVPVIARGTLYRLKPGSGKPPKRSPIRRDIGSSTGLVAYWPCEDGGAAGQGASALTGHPPLLITGPVTPGAVQDMQLTNWVIRYGTQALIDISAGGMLTGTCPADVTADTAAAWTCMVHMEIPDLLSASGDVVIAEVETPGGTYAKWQLLQEQATFRTKVVAITAAGDTATVIDEVGVSASFGAQSLSVWQDGATIRVGLNWLPAFNNFASTGAVSGTLAGVTRVTVNPTRATSNLPLLAGHIALWALPHHPLRGSELDDYGGVFSGSFASWAGEAAHLRLARLAAEDRIPIDMPHVDDPLAVVRMGWQPVEDSLTLYQQCVDADGGVLYERPFRLGYQPRTAREIQTPMLVLDAQADLAEAPEPDPTGQTYRNRWTVNRIDGSSAVAQTDEVTAGAIVHEDSADLNLARDSGLAHHAGWRLHLTSSKDLHWPKLVIDLAASPHLVDAWLNCRVGSRVLAINPPADVAGIDIDVLIEGAQTTLGYKTWYVVINCSPARVWDIATADGVQRAPADGSILDQDLDVDDPTLVVATTATNGPWSTDPDDYPLDLRVGGERITVEAPLGGTSPQTFPIAARGVNGVTRSWPAGTAVDVWNPAIAPL